jgi:peptidoglycan/LPS O-acetylase OafA/YrhL
MGIKANYLAGALIANAIVWIGTVLIPMLPLNNTDTWISLITAYFIISVIGGVLGGYLVARKTKTFAPLRLAVVLGAISYAILAVINSIRGVEPWVDSSALIGFITGFAIGSRVTELNRLKQQTLKKQRAESKK